ncbi:MAG: carboxyvinyl-carboxyphosphonate phosphorylmutase, partial [Actinobacteria bacterium]|nr:carboxyvinyl-carboxyphosphonate phosphorylmutase [Actinomycetota bacterium]
PTTREQLEIIGRDLSEWPLVANMVEGGKTPLLGADELAQLGFSLILFPGSIIRAVTSAAKSLLQVLADHGTTETMLDAMATFAEVNQLVGLSESDLWEQGISSKTSDRE